MGAGKPELSAGVEKHMLSASCMRCGAVIGRHEPLVIVGDGVDHTTLALRPRPPTRGEAIYHPRCYQPNSQEPRSSGHERVFREVICGVDGSEGSYAAVEQAASLVGPGGELTVLIVTSLRKERGQRSDATEMVEHATMLADRGGVSCTVEVDPARPVQEVVNDWATGHALVAIGAPPASVLAGLWFGGVTETAIRSLSGPLLVARPAGAAAHFGERMLVASDGLRGSDELVAFANRLANGAGSALTLVHALGRRSASRRARIDAQVHNLQADGIEGERAVIESGSADDTIIATSERLEASLVVMTSRRRSGLSALGSVSRRVVHHGRCSVLLVPPGPLQEVGGRLDTSGAR
ncbi:MAG TPA: universal stress protein [Solirubrobacteraceae bacterium]|nr:universal stress protein [Solirubrobacteraceae bacterium]